jgi:hypothetical protein
MYHYFINRSWMVSTTAQSVYRIAAWLSLGLFAMLISIPFLPELPSALSELFRLALFACVLGAAVTLVAMEYFLFGFDTSSELRKSLWFLALCLIPVGPAIYAFRVYSRSPVLECKPSERPEGMAEEFRGTK